ncbi:MAG TPA: hypothetical protein VF102_07095 [Gemmatimonadaceae bacterium]
MKRPPKEPPHSPRSRRHGAYRIDLPDEGEVLYRFYSEAGDRLGSMQVDAAIATPQFDDAMERLVDFFGCGPDGNAALARKGRTQRGLTLVTPK